MPPRNLFLFEKMFEHVFREEERDYMRPTACLYLV
jgi:hypothetical protein